MRIIHLTQSREAKVDDQDYPRLSKHNWCAVRLNGIYYAARKNTASPTGALLLMHRAILNFPKQRVDHRNGNGLDNQRKNLRRATHAQNMANQKIRANSKTGFRGVNLTPYGKFIARLRVAGKLFSLGTFTTAQEAAVAYNRAAVRHFGAFSRLNPV